MSKEIRIAICDDELYFLDKMKQYVEEICKQKQMVHQIKTFRHPLELLDENDSYDILFLDIELQEINGLAVAKQWILKDSVCKVVFVSSHQTYIQEGYKVRAFRFLYKPVQIREIEEVLIAVQDEKHNQLGIVLEEAGKKIWLSYSEIYAVQSIGDGVVFHLSNQTIPEKYTLRGIVAMADYRFFQCHKSYVVNFEKIKEVCYKKGEIILCNQLILPLSVRKKSSFKLHYHQFMLKKARFI